MFMTSYKAEDFKVFALKKLMQDTCVYSRRVLDNRIFEGNKRNILCLKFKVLPFAFWCKLVRGIDAMLDMMGEL